MKRFILTLFLFLFGLFVVGMSIWRSRPNLVSLAVESSPAAKEMVETEAVAGEVEDDYPLPYPGILPDHPLYFLKMIRDRVQLWLTRDSLARAELQLHYGDKRIAAALELAEQGKAGLAVSTASKAEGYLELAIKEAERAGEAGKDTSGFWEKVARASRKHNKVLVGVESRVPDEAKSAVEQVMDVNKRGLERAREAVGGTEGEKQNPVEDSSGNEGESAVDEEGSVQEDGE